MSVRSGSLVSHPVAVRFNAGTGMVGWGLLATSVALAFVPFVGWALSYVPSRLKNSLEAKADQDSLANHYRVQIAERLGISPEAVTRDDLLKLAAKDEAFGKLIQGSLNNQEDANRSVNISAAVGALLPGAGAIGSIAAGLAADVGLGKIFSKDDVSVSDAADYLDQVRAAGGMVQPEDVMLLRVAQNPELQEKIQQYYGAKFHKLSASKRVDVAKEMKFLYGACFNDKERLNAGLVTSQALAVEPPPAMNWQEVVGKKSKPTISHRAQVEAQRAQQVQAAKA